MGNNSNLPQAVGGGKQYAKVVVGTSTAGCSASDVDYLCNGTNDSTVIQQAIDSLPSTGGEIVFREGTYNITTGLTCSKANTVLNGNGAAVLYCDKRPTSSTEAVNIISITSSNCTACNIKFMGAYTNIDRTYNPYFFHCIDIKGDYNTVMYCKFEYTGYCVYINGNKNSAIYNVAHNVQGISMQTGTENSEGNIISGNTITINPTTTDEYFSQWTAGINLYGSYNTASNNVVYGSGIDISVGYHNLVTDNITISYKDPNDSTKYRMRYQGGMEITSSSSKDSKPSSYHQISNNMIIGGTIYLLGWSKDCPVDHTLISNNLLLNADISLFGSTNDTLVIGNIVHDADGTGISLFVRDANMSLCRNVITNNFVTYGEGTATYDAPISVKSYSDSATNSKMEYNWVINNYILGHNYEFSVTNSVSTTGTTFLNNKYNES